MDLSKKVKANGHQYIYKQVFTEPSIGKNLKFVKREEYNFSASRKFL
jgi:hypothetical protein